MKFITIMGKAALAFFVGAIFLGILVGGLHLSEYFFPDWGMPVFVLVLYFSLCVIGACKDEI